MISNVWPSERQFNKVTATGIKRAAVCFKSSFGPKLGTSPSPMVGGWPRCHGYSTLISMQTPSRCMGRPTAGRAWRSASDCPLTHKQRKACVNTNIMSSMQKMYISTRTNTCTCKVMAYGCTYGHRHFHKLDRSQLYSTSGRMLSVIHPPTSV